MGELAKFVNLTTLSKFGRFPRCPEDQGNLCTLSSIDREKTLLVFISHCWLRGDANPPHPDNEEGDKCKLCVKGIEKVWTVFAPRMKNCYVWMDYCCMPQNKDLSKEFSNYDEIVECCDVMFTPIVDPDHASWKVVSYSDLKDMCLAKSWRDGPRAYLNRAWCRVEMLYAAHIPVLDNAEGEVRRHTMFESGLAYHCREGRRLHVLYSTQHFVGNTYPDIVPPFLYCIMDAYHPFKGEIARESGIEAIKELITRLQKYVDMNTMQLGYHGNVNINGLAHGHGLYRYEDGSVYEGNWENGVRHGHGKYRFLDGDEYEGNFENDEMHGQGVYRYSSGAVCEGNWRNNERHGHGVELLSNGDVFKGLFENGMRHGYGEEQCADGSVYEGHWECGAKHGHGVYFYSNGAIYNGNWKDGVKHGDGVFNHSSGNDVFKGNYENGERNGYGVERYADGAVYEGDWKRGVKHGRGVYRYSDGAVYEGNFDDDERHGQGVYRYSDGAFYEGSWENDMRHGVGVEHWADGSVYEGFWENDCTLGNGVYHSAKMLH